MTGRNDGDVLEEFMRELTENWREKVPMEEPLPCPFCGGKADLVTDAGCFNDEAYRVVCRGCGAYVPTSTVAVSLHGEKNARALAIQKWNTRAKA